MTLTRVSLSIMPLPSSRFLIAAPSSGSGKTTLTLGLLRALRNRGLTVQPFKCGPDYLDTLHHGTAAELKRWLLARHGLLIRDAANFRGLTSGHFRLSTRPAADNQLLINALREWTDLPA